MNAIEFEHVSFQYAGSASLAVEDVSLVVHEGDRLVVLGPNGSGKTTLLKLMNGVLKPSTGRVTVEGLDTANSNASAIAKRVGLVFQNPNHQFFSQSCLEETRFALDNFGYEARQAEFLAEEALRRFDLFKYRDVSPFALSVGEKKRLSIASVAVYNPDVLALDEPTAGQDAKHKQLIGRLILDFPGKAVVATTHDVEFALTYFNRAMIMYKGRILEEGTPRDVFYGTSLFDLGLLPPSVVEVARLLKLDRRKPTNASELLTSIEEEILT